LPNSKDALNAGWRYWTKEKKINSVYAFFKILVTKGNFILVPRLKMTGLLFGFTQMVKGNNPFSNPSASFSWVTRKPFDTKTGFHFLCQLRASMPLLV